MSNDNNDTWIALEAATKNLVVLLALKEKSGSANAAEPQLTDASGGNTLEDIGRELASRGSDCDVAPITSQLRGSYRPLLTSAHGSGRLKEPPRELEKDVAAAALDPGANGETTATFTSGKDVEPDGIELMLVMPGLANGPAQWLK